MSPEFPPAAAAPPVLSDPLRARGLSLRAAETSDLPFLRDLFAGFRAPELALALWSEARKRAFTDDQFRLQHVHFTRHFAGADFWVVMQASALSSPRAIGRLYLDRSGREWRIVEIGFTADAQGQGLGSAMIEWIQNEAAAAGAAAVALQVAANNPRARALYLRLGFRDIGAAGDLHQPMAWRSPPQLNTA